MLSKPELNNCHEQMTAKWFPFSLSFGVSVVVSLPLLHHDDVDGAHLHLIEFLQVSGSQGNTSDPDIGGHI